MSKTLHTKSLSFCVLCTVTLGIIFVSISITIFVIALSKNIFIDTYGRAQEKVFMQIKSDLDAYHENLTKSAGAIDSSWAVRLYFGENKELENRLAIRTVYNMKRDVSKAIPSGINNMSVMIVGMEGQSYINRSEMITADNEEILSSKAAVKALENPNSIQYVYEENGFTSTTKNTPVFMGAKALTYLKSNECYAIVFFIMKEADMSDFYGYFASNYTGFYLTDENNKVLTSNDKTVVGDIIEYPWLVSQSESFPSRKLFKHNGKPLSVMQVELSYYDCMAYGVIDNDSALGRIYNISQIAVICAGISAIVLMLIFVITKQTTKPLSIMVKKMAKIRDGNFHQYMEVSGPEEVQELAVTYNYMLKDLQNYVDELIETQKEKRKSEIKALQMQINPHYIYNTLAGIKWLIMQGNVEKSTKMIDAFIMLLRNTISNSDEFINVNQEIENLKNYILINNTRYGDRVKVEYYVVNECEDYLLPKLILQPFIENAFFHAFPGDRTGTIQIFFSESDTNMKIRIIDDGVGMSEERLSALTGGNEATDKAEHYSGIGINNVDERLKLIYGADYGVSITSKENAGTNIQIHIPIRKTQI